MNKRIKIVCACAVLSLLSGCTKNANKADVDTTSGIAPNIISTSNLGTENYFYIVDKNTGVVYLGYDGFRRYGLSVMLNRDGTPVTAEQLEIKY